MVVFCQLFDHSLHLLLQLLHPETQKHWVSTHGCFRWNSTRCDNREETNKPQSHLHQRVLAQVGLRLHATGHQRKNFLWQLFLQLEDKQTDTYFCHFQTSFWETDGKRMCLVMMTDFVCVSRPAAEIALMFTLMALSISMVTSFSMLISWLDRFSSCFLTWWTFLKKQKVNTQAERSSGHDPAARLPVITSSTPRSWRWKDGTSLRTRLWTESWPYSREGPTSVCRRETKTWHQKEGGAWRRTST